MRTLRPAPLLAALLVSLLSGATHAGVPGVLGPELTRRLAAAGSAERVGAYVVLRDRLTLAELEEEVRGLGPRARRTAVRDRLRNHAAKTQAGLRALLDAEAARGRVEDVRVLWIGNAIVLRAVPDVLRAIAARPEVDRVRADVDRAPEELFDRGSGSVPFLDDFESGTLGPWWSVQTTGSALVAVSPSAGPVGTHHLLMTGTSIGSPSSGSVTVALDLSGQTNVGVRFKLKEFNDGTDAGDGVFVSDDGAQFHKVLGLEGGSTYGVVTLDLDPVVQVLGLSYTSTFHVRFAWTGDGPIPLDGVAFDDVEIGPGVGDPPPPAVEPHLQLLQAPALWDLGVDGAGVVAGHIDSGVDPSHPDLADRLWTNPGEVAGNLVDDDGNGYVDDLHGWDFENGDADPTGTDLHGTHVAGLLVGDGSAGRVTGMAVGGTFVPLRVASEADFWLAQQYCLDAGVDVVSSSVSFKWPQSPRPDYAMHRQVCNMELAAGIVHANSIGNQGNTTATHPVPFNVAAPGGCPQPWGHPDAAAGGRSSVLGCAGVLVADDSLYTDSGRGPSAWEDLTLYDAAYPHVQDPAAWDYPYGGFGGGGPGLLKPDVATYTQFVFTTTSGGGYAPFTGTSAATPQLGGGLMLLRQAQPEALPRHLAAAVELTAVDLGPPGKDDRFGAGKLQVHDAARRLVTLARIDDPTPALGQAVTIDLFGEPNAQVLGFLAASLAVSPTQFNLVPPFAPLGVFGLGPSGALSLPVTVPNLPILSGVDLEMQFGARPVPGSKWGGADLWSVPERVAVE